MATTTLTLNPDGVLNPLLKELWKCQNVILFGLRTTGQVAEIPSETVEEKSAFALKIGEPPKDLQEYKSEYTKWLVKKGFEDLVKGIKLSLIEAYFFVSIIDKKDNLTTLGELELEIQELRRTAIEQSLPGLFSKVTPHLKSPLTYQSHIESINKTRNCLVHADGLITERHMNNKTDRNLILKGIRWKLFYKNDGNEVEVKVGDRVEGGQSIMLGQEDFTKTFQEGTYVEISFEDFNNFIKTCYLFGLDLQSKLPELN